MRFLQAGVLLLGALMYVALILFSGDLTSSSNLQWILVIAGAWNLLFLIMTVLVVIDGIRRIRAEKTQELATGVLVVKLAAIPFFVLNFVVLGVLALGGALVFLFGGMVLLVGVAVGIGLTYLAMLSTSVYSWAAIALLRREGVIKPWLAAMYTFFSLVFVLDTVAGVLLFGHARRRPTLALGIVLLSFGVGSAVAGVVIDQTMGWDPDYGVNGFTWISVVGMVILLVAVGVSLLLIPALRREARHLAPAEEGTIASATPDRVLSD